MPTDKDETGPETRPGDVCALCGRAVPRLTRHHLIPRTRHRNRRNKREFARAEVHTRIAWLCPPCHKQIHAVLSEKELERTYNTIEALREQPEVSRFRTWLAEKPAEFQPTVRRPRRRR